MSTLFLKKSKFPAFRQSWGGISRHFFEMQDSLCTPHLYDLSNLMTPGKHLLTIRVDNSVKYDVGRNAHSISDHTQTNWNGIIGRIELQASDKVCVSDVQVYPDIEKKLAKLRIVISNAIGQEVTGTLTITANSWNTERRHTVRTASVMLTAPKRLYSTSAQCDSFASFTSF